MKSYYVEFKMGMASEVQGVAVLAKSKEEAYDTAVYREIPARTGHIPYSAWVTSVTYSNGNYHIFNTHEGMPY